MVIGFNPNHNNANDYMFIDVTDDGFNKQEQ